MKRIQAQKFLVLPMFFLLCCLPPAKAQQEQAKRITMEFKNEGLPSIFKRLEKLSGYKVLFIYDEINSYTSTGKVRNASIDKAIQVIIGKHPLEYHIDGKFVNITKVTAKQSIPAVKGKVTSEEDGLPVIGATVTVKGTNNRTITDVEGNFQLSNVPQDAQIQVSFIGLNPASLKPAPQMSIVMSANSETLDEVVVQAGIIQRNKMGFTGSYRTVNQEELKSVGNLNVLQSLKTLDPSFNIADNMEMGSDPNTMARVTMRGGTTMTISGIYDDTTTNPNEPLFILDGFETTLQEVNDLDINRIESITLLKDAASTAIYGSKGANGVVVIETIKPKEGDVMINYSGDAQVAWADLSGYNMMNAAEKLQYEVLAGRYGNLDDWAGNKDNIESYYSHLTNVQKGVDTYWLKVPIRTAITQSHSLNISGGGEGFLYQVGAMYKDTQGVMKDSDRETFGGNMRLTYRKNKLNISNNLSISITNGGNGAWGSFSNFVNANPYYPMRNADGTVSPDLDSYKRAEYYSAVVASNPLYNALLDSEDNQQNVSITNNLNFDWYILENLRWTASLSLNSSTSDNMSFIDPSHTQYASVDYTQQGQYTSSNSRSWRYVMNTGVSYALAFLNGHNLTANVRAEIESTSSNSKSFVATGFPKGVGAIPSFAYSYLEDSTPGYSEDISRGGQFLRSAEL